MPKHRTKHRIERDSLGEMRVPEDAYYGAQTARAMENFPISGRRFPRAFIRALGIVKSACARANADLGDLDPRIARAIAQASTEMAAGKLDPAFPVDVFQTGSGTSTNMNANEVIARRAAEVLGARVKKPAHPPIHPNDHVNMSQSSNDVIPTAIHVSVACTIHEHLVPALAHLERALAEKARAFDGVVKSGRTHLMDATPVRLGQEFAGYARRVASGGARAARARDALLELALGGTAVGTGLNRRAEFPARAIAYIRKDTGLAFREAADHFEAQGAKDACMEASGLVKAVAVGLAKVAGDLRLMASGPAAGLGEITLPAVQPGSSIMPGKVNPVICEAVVMVAAQVVANDAAVTLGGLGGTFELNLMMPLIAVNLLASVEWLAAASRVLADRCVSGIVAHEEHMRAVLERNLAVCTALAPRIGYDRAAALAKEAAASRKTVREVARASGAFTEAELDRLLDYRRMTEPEP
jgi:fumarate hydratase class II